MHQYILFLLVACATADVGQYKIMSNGTLCGQVSANISILVPYTTADHKNATASVPVPFDAEVEEIANCTFDVEDLTLKFYNDWVLVLSFTNGTEHGAESKSWMLFDVAVAYNSATATKYFPNIGVSTTGTTQTNDSSLHGVSSQNGYAYECKTEPVSINVGGIVTAQADHFTAQPFSNNEKFSVLSTCKADQKTGDLVPIIVGASLALLVVVVLIAYIVGRVRAKRQGYSSV